RIVDNLRLAVDPHRVVDARNHEQDTDFGIGDDVEHGIGAIVAGPVGNDQRLVVDDAHEARRIAARRNIGIAVRIGGADAKEGRAGNIGSRIFVELRKGLAGGKLAHFAELVAQLLPSGDCCHNFPHAARRFSLWTHSFVRSRPFSTMSNISLISSAVMTSGGQKATESPIERTSSPNPWRMSAQALPTPCFGPKARLVFLSATSSSPPISPTARPSPTSGWSASLRIR